MVRRCRRTKKKLHKKKRGGMRLFTKPSFHLMPGMKPMVMRGRVRGSGRSGGLGMSRRRCGGALESAARHITVREDPQRPIPPLPQPFKPLAPVSTGWRK